MKNIPISKKTWRKLKEIKRNKGFNVLNQTIEYLVDRDENRTLPAGELKEESKPKNITPVAPEDTLSEIYKVEDSLEKERRDLGKLRDEKAHAEHVRATEELRSAITNEIHAKEAYENTKREMDVAEKETIRVRSDLDEIKQLFGHLKLRE